MANPMNDPRDAETRRVAENVADQLRQRGVDVRDEDGESDLGMLLTAAQHFARAVAANGGDSFTNTPESTQPDNPEFVMPQRSDDESAVEYARRIEGEAQRLKARAD
jgi:hypothetical protein